MGRGTEPAQPVANIARRASPAPARPQPNADFFAPPWRYASAKQHSALSCPSHFNNIKVCERQNYGSTICRYCLHRLRPSKRSKQLHLSPRLPGFIGGIFCNDSGKFSGSYPGISRLAKATSGTPMSAFPADRSTRQHPATTLAP